MIEDELWIQFPKSTKDKYGKFKWELLMSDDNKSINVLNNSWNRKLNALQKTYDGVMDKAWCSIPQKYIETLQEK